MRAGRILLLIVASLIITGVVEAGPPKAKGNAKAKPKSKPELKLKASALSGQATVKVPWSEAQLNAQLNARLKAFYAADAVLRAGLATAKQRGIDSPALRQKYSDLYARLLQRHHAAVAASLQRLYGAQGYPCRADGSCIKGLTCIFGRCRLVHDAPHRGPGPKKQTPLPPRPKRRSPPR